MVCQSPIALRTADWGWSLLACTSVFYMDMGKSATCLKVQLWLSGICQWGDYIHIWCRYIRIHSNQTYFALHPKNPMILSKDTFQPFLMGSIPKELSTIFESIPMSKYIFQPFWRCMSIDTISMSTYNWHQIHGLHRGTSKRSRSMPLGDVSVPSVASAMHGRAYEWVWNLKPQGKMGGYGGESQNWVPRWLDGWY